jgi:hypothetical protein
MPVAAYSGNESGDFRQLDREVNELLAELED